MDRASVGSPGVDSTGVGSAGVGSPVWAAQCAVGLDTTELSRAVPDPAHGKGCELLQVEAERCLNQARLLQVKQYQLLQMQK